MVKVFPVVYAQAWGEVLNPLRNPSSHLNSSNPGVKILILICYSMHIELSIGDNNGIELSEVVFFSCIFVGIAAVVAFIPSTLQLDI